MDLGRYLEPGYIILGLMIANILFNITAVALMLAIRAGGVSFWRVPPTEQEPEIEPQTELTLAEITAQKTQLEMDVLWLGITYNDRWCSVRSIYDLANERYNPFVDKPRYMSRNFIEETLRKYSWNPETGGPFFAYHANGRDYFFSLLDCEDDMGRGSRRLIPVTELYSAWLANDMYSKKVQSKRGPVPFAPPDAPLDPEPETETAPLIPEDKETELDEFSNTLETVP